MIFNFNKLIPGSVRSWEQKILDWMSGATWQMTKGTNLQMLMEIQFVAVLNASVELTR